MTFLTANGDRIITFKEPVPNKTMEDHVIRREEVPNEGSCRVNCYLHPDCVSINMGPLTGGKLTCELNNATAQKESALGSKEGHTYLEIQVKLLSYSIFPQCCFSSVNYFLDLCFSFKRTPAYCSHSKLTFLLPSYKTSYQFPFKS